MEVAVSGGDPIGEEVSVSIDVSLDFSSTAVVRLKRCG